MINFKTKTEAVSEKLRQKILNGELKPGQRIIISELAKEFGTSEIPIREAIRRFESDGLVTYTPHVGAVVNLMANDEFLEIYLMRIELEVLATKLATPHITRQDINDLNKIIYRAEQAITAGEQQKLGPLNKSFHLRIYKVGPYPHLFKSIVELWERFELIPFVPKRAVPSWEEHKLLVDALADHNARLASKIVRQQKNRTKKAIERVFNKQKPTDQPYTIKKEIK